MSITGDNVLELTSTTGTGTYSLSGVPSSDWQSFVAGCGAGAQVFYVARNATGKKEFGIGTITAGTPDTLSRDTILESSNAGAAVNWQGADGQVYIHTAAAGYLVDLLYTGRQSFVADAGAADAYSLAPSPKITAYAAGMVFATRIANANATTTPTLAVSGLAAKTITWPDGSALAAGDLPAGATVRLMYDATADAFKLLTVTKPPLLRAGGALSGAIDLAKSAGVASAATTNIWQSDGNLVHITGTTTITSFGTAAQAGATRKIVFDAALTLTNGANLILPGGANITTAAGDSALVVAETTSQHRVIAYHRANGRAVSAGGWQHIETQTVSGAVASVDFVGLDNVAYDQFMLVFHNLACTVDGSLMYVRLRQEGGTWRAGATEYEYSFRFQDDTTDGAASSAGAAQFYIGGGLGNAADETAAGMIVFHGFGLTGPESFCNFQTAMNVGDGTLRATVGGGRLDVKSIKVDGIRFLMDSGNIDDGTFKLYGLAA